MHSYAVWRGSIMGFVAEARASMESPRMRWVFVGICALLSVVLAGSMASNFLGARQLSDTVVRGQAGMVFHLLHRYAPPGPPPPAGDELHEAFEQGRVLGLRYVALVDARGVVVEVGDAQHAVGAPPPPGAGVEHIGDVVRVWSPRGPRPGFEGKAPPPGHPPFEGIHPFEGKRPPGRRPPFPGGPPTDARYVIDFVPTQAVAMAERAQLDLYIGLGSIVFLWVGALAFWKLSRRASMVGAELAHKRHLASLGEMSAVIAHELRNPLASLKGHAQLLREQAGDDKLRRKATRVVDEAVRLQALTNDLLDFVRSGRVEPASTPVAELVRESIAGSVATVDAVLEDAPRSWVLDRARMRQVLVNLLDNAHHASPETSVELKAEVDGGALVFVVHDWGPGVPEKDRQEIFAPFHTGRTQGTGVGLAVCQRIVEEHGGTVRCDDHPDGGAMFTVTIPEQRGPKRRDDGIDTGR